MRRLARLLVSAWASWTLSTACGAVESDPGRVCAWRGRRSSGACPSLCTWQCNVAAEETNACERGGCRERCILERLEWTSECLDAAHAEWVCVIGANLETSCETEAPVTFGAAARRCEAEHAAASAACGSDAPLALAPTPSLCEWQCELTEAVGCGTTGCLEACRGRDDALPETCRAAALAHWSCLADRGRSTRCCERTIRFESPPGQCEEELAATVGACAGADPLSIVLPDLTFVTDAGPKDASRNGDADGAASGTGAATLPAELGPGWRVSCDDADAAADAPP